MSAEPGGTERMSDLAKDLRSPKERSLHYAAIMVGTVLWLPLVGGLWAGMNSPQAQVAAIFRVYTFYFVTIWIFFLVGSAAYRATAFGNMMLLGPRQFPRLHEVVVESSKALGITPPRTFIYNSNGLFNAFARRLMGGRYVFLTSALVDAESDNQVKFVIGHELGHHAAGHLNPWLNALKLPAHLIPFLMPAYSRAREYSCDHIGVRLTGDPAAARSSLQMLGCGCKRLNDDMNPEAFVEQEALVPPLMGFLTEIVRSHPRLTRRLIAIQRHAPFKTASTSQ